MGYIYIFLQNIVNIVGYSKILLNDSIKNGIKWDNSENTDNTSSKYCVYPDIVFTF